MQVTTGFAEVNGTKLYFESTGKGPPLLLLHAGPVDCRMWDFQFKEFAKKYKVIRYDARGFGKSQLPNKPFSPVKDVIHLLNFLKIKKTNLMGCSLGGGTALEFALDYPRRVDRLILVGPSLGGFAYSEEMQQKGAELFNAAKEKGAAEAIRIFLNDPFWSYSVPSKDYPEALEKFKKMANDNSRIFDWYSKIVETKKLPAVERLPEIKIPTLVIVGDRELADTQKATDLLKKEIKGAKKIVIAGGGHMINMEKPGEFNKIVLEFLSHTTNSIKDSTLSTQKKMTRIKKETGGLMNTNAAIQLQVIDAGGKGRRFRLGEPQSVSREVFFKGETRSSNAFYLPRISSRTFELEGQFLGDVRRGGSCNVDILKYAAHGLTHLETSAHILSPDANPPTVKDIPLETLSGIVYLIDLSHLGTKQGELVPWEAIRAKLERNRLPISMLALKTRASLLPQDYDFSGKDFLSVAPETAKGIHDYRLTDSRIDCLILDIPSIDPEKDGGKLLAHRNFFGLPAAGIDVVDTEKRALVELAWFSGLKEGYYYALITPPRFQTDAVATGIIFQPLIEVE